MLDKGEWARKPVWPRLPGGHGEMVQSRSSNHSLYGPFLPAGGPGWNAKNPGPPPTVKQALCCRDSQTRTWAQRGHAACQGHTGMEADANSGPRSQGLIWCLLDWPPRRQQEDLGCPLPWPLGLGPPALAGMVCSQACALCAPPWAMPGLQALPRLPRTGPPLSARPSGLRTQRPGPGSFLGGSSRPQLPGPCFLEVPLTM